MDKIKLMLLVVPLALACCRAQTPQVINGTPVAVVELFTSEGCSSCPPADKLLARYSEDSMHEGVRVFPLAFHVDYWDYLGWKDAFSKAAFSRRQRMYVEALHLNGAYTPQMVVNGNEQFVGSDEEALKNALQAVAKEKPTTITFAKITCTQDTTGAKISYTLSGDARDYDLNIALVSAHESIFVKRGENGGRQLAHTNVVKEFMTEQALAHSEIKVPYAIKTSNACYVVYLQHKISRKIVAAVKLGE